MFAAIRDDQQQQPKRDDVPEHDFFTDPKRVAWRQEVVERMKRRGEFN